MEEGPKVLKGIINNTDAQIYVMAGPPSNPILSSIVEPNTANIRFYIRKNRTSF